MEVWKEILECPNYHISNFGRVRNLKSMKILTPTICSDFGHSQIRITIKGRKHTELIHRLVARYFIPNPKNLPIVNHIDNNPKNNKADNLEWCTHSYNQLHSVKTGMSKNRLGSGCHKAIITEQRALNVFELSQTHKITEVAKIIGVTPSIVHKIKNGYSWNHITGLPRKRYTDSKIKISA
jgi:hypothetical protein